MAVLQDAVVARTRAPTTTAGTPPGHVPVTNEPGTEFVSFSPSEELRTAEAVMMKNM
jgi:hypothetical protein